MARYHNEFSFQADPNLLLQQIHQYMMAEGYIYRDFKGEQVYKKGMGVATGPSFIKVMVDGGRIILEAWIKFAALPGVYAGEMGLNGAAGAIPKSFLRTRVQYIEYLIMQAGGINLGAVVNMPPEMPLNMPQQNVQQPLYTAAQQPQQVYNPIQPEQSQSEPIAQKLAPAFCDQCGNRLEPGVKFCDQCGKKIQ